jgi:hypothetical protein
LFTWREWHVVGLGAWRSLALLVLDLVEVEAALLE